MITYRVMGRSGPIGRGLSFKQAYALAKVSGCRVEAEGGLLEGVGLRISDGVPKGAIEIHRSDGTFDARIWLSEDR